MNLSSLIDGFSPSDGPPPRTLAAFFKWCLKGAMPILGLAAAVSATAGVLEVMTALLLGLVIDGAILGGADFVKDSWLMLLGIAAFFVVLRPLVFGTSAAMQSLAVAPNITTLVLSRLNRYTLGHAISFFDDDFAGRIAQKQMQTSRAVNEVVVELINVVAFALASLVGSALLLTTIDWRIALVLAVWLVGYLSLIRWFMPRIRVRSAAQAGARANLTGQIVDTVTNIKTVKLFAHHRHEDAVALDAMEDWRLKKIYSGTIATLFRFSLMTIAGTLPVFLLGSVLWLWTLGLASPGDIAATGAVSIRIAQMTGWVSFVLMAIYANIGEVEDGMRTLTPPHDLPDAVDAVALKVTRGEIRFEGASFAYGREKGGIDNVSLTIHPGEKLGIVGASGAGKSTLVSLLLRLYDTEKGAVFIDGQNLRDVTQESLRQQISTVTQETAMFNRSAHDNILYGHPDATVEQVKEAALRAEAHQFIEGMQDLKERRGYAAHLGERGVKLSGGQRQRIALARAILKDAPILILDEATSALDSEVEAAIQTALERVMEGKTVLAIAHRLSTIARMDRIVVLEEGRIAEIGTHQKLLHKSGLYARYWSRQSGGFIGINEAAE
ncbi:ABC transporter ATP-binding protein [Pseudohalocynthiibacter aestuariivivens]|uniref:ABC transporter ATP-binding protein n=1 Tax=Pseudohalocynthiibacter aestuariivivens TaxID=1591409 RepID=A0ABV5JJW7_9RHOB|nr:ABC transporter ATP-binding protein [Pseudohalocynthiibacter aestuariivivens]MCK0102828.1 ABC transporter ATP-binding protein/permease [Pseudohalocynthiibacter sp. F2068]